MGLASEGGRDGSTGRLDKAGASGGETDVSLRQVQFAHVVVASIAVFVSLGGILRGDRKLGVYFVERMLRGGQSELALEQRGL